MAHEYCQCDRGLDPIQCNCDGVTITCTCDTYTSAQGQYDYAVYDNFTKEGCPNLVYTPEDTYDSADVTAMYNLLDSKIKRGEIIYSEDIEELWDTFIHMIEVKKNYNYAGEAPSYNYEKPLDIKSDELIKAEHFEHLKDNIHEVHGSTPALNEYTGSGFVSPDGVIYKSTTDSATTEYLREDVIFANEVAKLAKWIGASLYQCICNHNVEVKCCSCNMVCDCNY